MRLKLIACEIFYRELCAAVARSPHQVDIEFLPKGLHDIGQAAMSARLGETLAAVDTARYEAVLLGYALCSNGIVGLHAHELPLVVPRAHDCITLFFGSRTKYTQYFEKYPGTYFKTTGWIERGDARSQSGFGSLPSQSAGLAFTYEDLVAKYGEDNARYIWEQFTGMAHYSRFTYIRMGVAADEPFERRARQEAAARGWTLDVVDGDMGMIQRLVDGVWNEDEFLVVQPGQRIATSFDDLVIKAEERG